MDYVEIILTESKWCFFNEFNKNLREWLWNDFYSAVTC
jgi:hypothetical protein